MGNLFSGIGSAIIRPAAGASSPKGWGGIISQTRMPQAAIAPQEVTGGLDAMRRGLPGRFQPKPQAQSRGFAGSLGGMLKGLF